MTPRLTHYVPYDYPGRRLARAVCGALVDRRVECSDTPTCPACQQQLAAREAMEV